MKRLGSYLVGSKFTTDGRQTEAIFRILRENGVRNVSLVTADTPYGETFARLAPDAAAAMGVGIAGAASVDASDDFAKIAAQIGDEEPGMVVAAVYPEEAVRLAEALAAAGSPAGLFLTDAGRSPYLLESLGERAERIQCTCSPASPRPDTPSPPPNRDGTAPGL